MRTRPITVVGGNGPRKQTVECFFLELNWLLVASYSKDTILRSYNSYIVDGIQVKVNMPGGKVYQDPEL